MLEVKQEMDKLIEELVKYNETLYTEQPKIIEAERSRLHAVHLRK